MKKPQWILIGITAAFCCILIGVFIGRNMAQTFIPADNAIHSATDESTDAQQNHDGRININTATEQQLMLISGIGEVTAQKIIAYRTENGDFKVVEDLLNVSGIGEKKLEQMKPYIKTE